MSPEVCIASIILSEIGFDPQTVSFIPSEGIDT